MHRISVRGAAMVAVTVVVSAAGGVLPLGVLSAPDAPPVSAEERLVAAAVGVPVVVTVAQPVVAPARAMAAARAARSAQRRTLTARELGRGLAAGRGWRGEQWDCLDRLWARESGWQVSARNPRSGAYGIPQALPAAKMAGAGPRWRTDAATQIRWGLGYVEDRFGSPCRAWRFFRVHRYY